MNIISYNVRGLGRGVKWPTIKRLVIRHKVDMLCLQETKKEFIDKSTCQALWGGTLMSAGSHNPHQIQQGEFFAFGTTKLSS